MAGGFPFFGAGLDRLAMLPFFAGPVPENTSCAAGDFVL